MDKAEWIEKEVTEKEKKMKLDAHNRNTLRAMLSKEHDYWEGEEGRVLKDSGRYHDDY